MVWAVGAGGVLALLAYQCPGFEVLLGTDGMHTKHGPVVSFQGFEFFVWQGRYGLMRDTVLIAEFFLESRICQYSLICLSKQLGSLHVSIALQGLEFDTKVKPELGRLQTVQYSTIARYQYYEYYCTYRTFSGSAVFVFVPDAQ